MPPFADQNLCGWGGPEAARRALKEIDYKPISYYRAPREPKKVLLWDFAKKVRNGEHIPNFPQQIGDCVSFGMANAIMYLSCMQICQGGSLSYHPIYQPYIYGISRVQIGNGRLGNSDGSLGSWAAEGVKKYGILFADDEGVPNYSGGVAKQWGARPGPPQKFIDLAKDNPVKSTALVRSYDEAADAISNGYPITVASMGGFEGDGNMQGRIRDGKCWGVWGGSWPHQMAFIGVDPQAEALFCINSWGSKVWPEHPDGAPPGGFWVEKKYAQKMLSEGDSWACSQFDGFPSQDLDWMLA
jgi:hypothetical protein